MPQLVVNIEVTTLNKPCSNLKNICFNLPAGRQECGTQHIQTVKGHAIKKQILNNIYKKELL